MKGSAEARTRALIMLPARRMAVRPPASRPARSLERRPQDADNQADYGESGAAFHPVNFGRRESCVKEFMEKRETFVNKDAEAASK